MRRREFLAIFGLLLLQALSAVYFSLFITQYLVELVVSAWFVLSTGIFVHYALKRSKHASAVASFTFLVAIVNVVILSIIFISVWQIIILSLAVAGMMLSWDVLDRKRTHGMQRQYSETILRKDILDKELPPRPPTKVVIYGEDKVLQKKTTKKTAKKKLAKKTITKKRARKTTTKKKSTKKKTLAKKVVSKK